MAVGSTQPLTERSTRSISWGKGGRGIRLTTLLPSRAFVMKSGSLNFREPSGPLQACNGTALPLLVCVRGWDSRECNIGAYNTANSFGTTLVPWLVVVMLTVREQRDIWDFFLSWLFLRSLLLTGVQEYRARLWNYRPKRPISCALHRI